MRRLASRYLAITIVLVVVACTEEAMAPVELVEEPAEVVYETVSDAFRIPTEETKEVELPPGPGQSAGQD